MLENETQLKDAHTVETFHSCQHKFTILLRSTNKKMCKICKSTKEWVLKEGQQPLITSSKDRMV